MLIAITGTPGTGKSTIGKELSSKGLRVIEVSDLAKASGLLREKDVERNSYDIDVDELDEAVEGLRGGELIVLVGHLAHLVRPDVTIVLRCRPSILEQRLMARGWSGTKVRENVEAEAVDTILIEAIEAESKVFEIDTSELTSKEVAEAVMDIVRGKTDKYAPGNIDWSDEVLKWY